MTIERILALSNAVDCLLASDHDDQHVLGVDLALDYVNDVDVDTLDGPVRQTVTDLRRALELSAQRTEGAVELLSEDVLARDAVREVIDSQTILKHLVRRRFQEHINADHQPVKEHLHYIDETLDADPDGRLAVSLYNLSHEPFRMDLSVSLVRDYLGELPVARYPEEVAADIERVQRAWQILRDEIRIGPHGGMTFGNLRANVQDLGTRLNRFATTGEARIVIRRIINGIPELSQLVAEDTAPVPF